MLSSKIADKIIIYKKYESWLKITQQFTCFARTKSFPLGLKPPEVTDKTQSNNSLATEDRLDNAEADYGIRPLDESHIVSKLVLKAI